MVPSQARLSCHLFYRLSAKKNTFSLLICMKGSHYFQPFNLINSNNLGAVLERQRNGFFCKLTCWWATRKPLWPLHFWTPCCRGTWGKGILLAYGKLRPLSTLDRDRQVPSGQWRDPGFVPFCVLPLGKGAQQKSKEVPGFTEEV